jgi:hypothetical protein
MKSHCFGVYYLGGSVELLRLHEHLGQFYPGATLITRSQDTVLRVPIAGGTMPAAPKRPEFPYEAVNYQFDHGFGLAMITFQSDQPIPDLIAGPSQFVFQDPGLAGAILAYLYRAFGVNSLSEINSLASTRERRQSLKTRTGIRVITAGLDEANGGFRTDDTLWLVGKDIPGLDVSKAEDLSELSPGRVFRLGAGRYWSPAEDEDVLWDLARLELREISGGFLHGAANGWLDRTQTQLEQMSTMLAERNRTTWNREREDVEQFDVNFHRFATGARRQLITGALPSLEVVDRRRWDQWSNFTRQQELTGAALDEAHRAIERMTGPLDFREFQLLKTGVEEVEGRIMLLTVLLVLMEFFALAIEPGHLTSKGILLALVILIPAAFIAFERWRRQAVARHSRELLTRQRLEETRSRIAEAEREIKSFQSDELLAAGTRESLLREMKEMVGQLKARQEELSADLKGRR